MTEGLQEEDEGARERSLGRLPRHDDLPGDPVGGHQRPARGEDLRDRRRRAVLHRLALRRVRRLGLAVPRTCDSSDQGRYFWGYANMSTVKGLFCAGDASGASSHKFSSGSHAEGRIAAKAAVKFVVDNNTDAGRGRRRSGRCQGSDPEARRACSRSRAARPRTPRSTPTTSGRACSCSVCRRSWTNTPAASRAQFTTNASPARRGLELLQFLREDAENLAAEDLHELMRCWENVHRMWQAEAHVRTMLFREETRWPGYYFRSDKPTDEPGRLASASPTANTIPRPIAGR